MSSESVRNDDMRIIYTGAADIIIEYALSPCFNWERDKDILRPIIDSVEKLIDILEAGKKKPKS